MKTTVSSPVTTIIATMSRTAIFNLMNIKWKKTRLIDIKDIDDGFVDLMAYSKKLIVCTRVYSHEKYDKHDEHEIQSVK